MQVSSPVFCLLTSHFRPLCCSFTGEEMAYRDSVYIDEDKILRVEAEEAVKEVAFAVKSVEISKVLENSETLVYLNVVTKEHEHLCVELTAQGFRVVGHGFDAVEAEKMSQYFETIYSLLDHFSPEYRRSFGDALMTKLSNLQQQQDEHTTG